MKTPFLHTLKGKADQVNWPLLVFLILVLNVKLVVKVAAVIFICIYNRKQASLKEFFKQQYLLFYFGMICIGFVNLLLHYKTAGTAYLVTMAMGLSFWVMCSVIAYQLYIIVQKGESQKLHNTVTVFFILHIALVFIDLSGIIIKTGALNPYTYRGMNQKYYISTGDSISGITFDAPVATSFICAFGLLYFLYRRHFLLSIACMGALIIMASNFTNLILLAVLLFAFVFYSSRIQKSIILIYMVMLVIFMAKISPQNNEHVGRIFYQVLNKPYDLPPVKVIPLSQLKKEPDSVLSFEERRKKYAQNYIDSMNFIGLNSGVNKPMNISVTGPIPVVNNLKKDSGFYQFQESPATEAKINQYMVFLKQMFSDAQRDSLTKLYNWKNPGKWIAARQLLSFFKDHPALIWFGTGTGNFSSRLAFKASLLNIAGRYPENWKYISPDFLNNHLYLYLYYHAQDQSKHEATNTPDAVYFQVAGEYGIIGIAGLLFLYFGFFIRRIKANSFGLPLLLILAGSFFAEYWFEQFSIVILFELLFFLDLIDMRREEQPV